MFQSYQNGPISYPVPPTELDAMLADIPNQVAHAQMLRRFSGNSSSNSISSRRTSAKILKANSVGHSPHNCNVQRRKTTTSQPTRPQARGLKSENNYTSWRQVAQGRPTTWHPGSRKIEIPARNIPTSEPTLRNTIAGLETLAVGEVPMPSTRPFVENNTRLPPRQPLQENDMALHPQYSINQIPAMFEQLFPGLEGYQQLEAGNAAPFSSYPSYYVPGPAQNQNPPLPYRYGYDQYASEESRASYWTHMSSDVDDYPVPQTPDFLPIQYPVDSWESSDLPQITKKKSNELVGMGLYDNTERDVLSTFDCAQGQDSNHHLTFQRESMGKGLKLEETWQPPKEDEGDDEDEDEASSSDEAEEDIPVSFTQDQTQPVLYPTYGDLSNQTFFFDNDDPYTNCIAFDQTMQACQLKAPDPVGENSLWF